MWESFPANPAEYASLHHLYHDEVLPMDRVAGKVSSYCCRRHRRFRPRRVWKAHGGTGISLVQSISDRSRDRCASPWSR